MQHGSARPCAVKYISDHGRRQPDHGCGSSPACSDSPGSVAPEASSRTPSSAASSVAAAMTASSSARHAREQRLIGPRQAATGLVVHQALQIDLRHPEIGGQADEVRQFRQRLAAAR